MVVRAALVFLVFDAAVVLLVPAVLVLRRWVVAGMAFRAVAELAVFVLVLSLGLAYAWKKGDLDA
jgi:NADH:ubiquinone oxidoreductase subunit 3 (subunit A)